MSVQRVCCWALLSLLNVACLLLVIFGGSSDLGLLGLVFLPSPGSGYFATLHALSQEERPAALKERPAAVKQQKPAASKPAPWSSYSGSLRALSQGQRLAALKPVSWVHVPKCGSPIMNAVMHLPGVCPGLTAEPRDQLCSNSQPDCNAVVWLRKHGGARSGPPDVAPKACPGIRRWALHYGFNTSYLSGQKGHGLIMLRQPEQRLVSGYHNEGERHGWNPKWGEPASIVQYAEVVQGASVKLLTRDSTDHYFWGPPKPEEIVLAVSRLRDGFAFLGIVEEFELSVCLLHAMFGNECEPREFGAFHIGKHRQSSNRYKVSQLKGFKDRSDRAVFAMGMYIFQENLRLYGVSLDSCRACFRRGNVSQSRLERVGRFVNAWDPSVSPSA